MDVSLIHIIDYKKFKSEDIISFMLTLFEQADFIKEIQSLLGERLLSVGYDDTELEKEVCNLECNHCISL